MPDQSSADDRFFSLLTEETRSLNMLTIELGRRYQQLTVRWWKCEN